MKWRAAFIFLLTTLGMILGCGDPNAPKLVKVYGKVTFNGGPPPADTIINFAPLDAGGKGTAIRPGTAKLDSSGNYKASSFNPGDGLIPGKYKVNLQCWKVPPTMAKPAGVSYLPPTFQAQELLVDANQSSMEFNLDAPVVK